MIRILPLTAALAWLASCGCGAGVGDGPGTPAADDGAATPAEEPVPVAGDGPAAGGGGGDLPAWGGALDEAGVATALGDLRTVADARLGYRVRVPASWRVTDHTASDGPIRADLVADDATGMQLRSVPLAGDDAAAAFDAYVERYRGEMEGHHGGRCARIATEWPTPDRARATLRHDRPDGASWLLLLYLARDGDRAIVAQAGTPWVDGHPRLAELDAVAGSLAFDRG